MARLVLPSGLAPGKGGQDREKLPNYTKGREYEVMFRVIRLFFALFVYLDLAKPAE